MDPLTNGVFAFVLLVFAQIERFSKTATCMSRKQTKKTLACCSLTGRRGLTERVCNISRSVSSKKRLRLPTLAHFFRISASTSSYCGLTRRCTYFRFLLYGYIEKYIKKSAAGSIHVCPTLIFASCIYLISSIGCP